MRQVRADRTSPFFPDTPDPDLVYRAAARVEQDLKVEVDPVIATHDAWLSDDRSGLLASVHDGALIPLIDEDPSSR